MVTGKHMLVNDRIPLANANKPPLVAILSVRSQCIPLIQPDMLPFSKHTLHKSYEYQKRYSIVPFTTYSPTHLLIRNTPGMW